MDIEEKKMLVNDLVIVMEEIGKVKNRLCFLEDKKNKFICQITELLK